jgi:hypothetical protein
MSMARIRMGAAALALLLVGAAPPSSAPSPVGHYSQVIVREQLVVRIPAGPGISEPVLVRWKEGKGPKCVPWRMLAGAAVTAPASVDFVLRDNRRLRAKLDSSCPALDYYRGFYIAPNPDGQICADRDIIRSRMGGECGIDRFRSLKAKRVD